MKRLVLRISALSGVVVLGGIAIAQAQRGTADPPTSPPVNAAAPGAGSILVKSNSADTPRREASPPVNLFDSQRGSEAAPSSSPTSTNSAASPFSRPAPSAGDAGASPYSAESTRSPAQEPFNTTRGGNGAPAEYAPASRYAPPSDNAAYAQDGAMPNAAGSTNADGRFNSSYGSRPDPTQALQPGDAPSGSPPAYDPASRYGNSVPARDDRRFVGQESAADVRFGGGTATASSAVEDRPATEGRLREPAALEYDRNNPPQRLTQPSNVDARLNSISPSTEPGGGAEGTAKPGSKHLEGPQSPALVIEKKAPSEIQIGKPATFEVLVRNTGKSTAQGVMLQDQVPKGTRLIGSTPLAERTAEGDLLWNLGTLEPGEQQIVKVELMPIDEGEIGSVATVYFTAQSSVRTLATRPELVIDVTAPREALIGDNVPLKIRISNPGTGPATGVLLREMVPEGLSHPGGNALEYEVGTLRPKETRELELVLKAAKRGLAENLLTAQGDGTLRAQHTAQIEIIAPELQVSLDGPKRRFLDREATYTIAVSNPGTAPAKEIELVTYLPKGFDFVKADHYGEFDPKTRAVRWSLEELPANQTGTVSLTAIPTEAGEHKMLTESTALQGLTAKNEQAVTVEGVAAILFQVADVADPIEIGGETTYEIHVINQGSKAATDIQLDAILPEQVKALSAEGPTRHLIENGRVAFDVLPRLAPKADTTYRVRVQGLQAGDARIRVRLLTAEMTSPVVKEESTRVFAD